MDETSPHLRTATELIAKATELRTMAATATTTDVKDALLRLASRYEAIAAVRGSGRLRG